MESRDIASRVPSDGILNCEYEGILGPVAGIVGNIQAIEILKKILIFYSEIEYCTEKLIKYKMCSMLGSLSFYFSPSYSHSQSLFIARVLLNG